MIPFYSGAFNDLSPLRVQKLGPEPGDEPLHQSHPVEGGHQVEAVRIRQGGLCHFQRDGKTQLLAGMSGTACFALIFGGTIRSALAAAAAGLIVSGYLLLCEKRGLSSGFRKISAAALITLVCILGCHLLDTEASHAIIGALMILTPGIAFTMGIRDFVQGDYLSGTIRMIDALLIAASIAIGTGLVLSLTSILTGVTVV